MINRGFDGQSAGMAGNAMQPQQPMQPAAPVFAPTKMGMLPAYNPRPMPPQPMGGVPGNTGIVPPHLNPNDMYRSFIRGRLGIGGDPNMQSGVNRPVVDWQPRPRNPYEQPGYGAGGNNPVVDWQPRPRTMVEAPAGTGGFYPGGGYGAGGNRPIVDFQDRPHGMGGYGGFIPNRPSLYDEIG